MVRASTLTLNQDNGSKALAVGQYVANGGGVDGCVCRLVRHPCGVVLVTVESKRTTHALKHILLQGDLDCEVLSETERLKLAAEGKWKDVL